MEEPVLVESASEWHQLIRQLSNYPIPIALDESLLLPDIDEFLGNHKDVRVINKTSLHGISGAADVFHDATRTTITCTFETGVGLGFLTAFAFAVNPSGFHGIHALPAMAAADACTRKFSELVACDEYGLYVDVVQVVNLCPDSTE